MALTLDKAVSDGFFVRGYDPHRDENDAILFAGTLSHCLAFMESRMRPAEKAEGITGAGKVHHATDIDWSGVKAPDCTEAELEAARREIDQPGGVVRATPVDLRDISAPGYSVDSEWDGGAAAAFAAIGKAWREKQEQVPFKYPPDSMDTLAKDTVAMNEGLYRDYQRQALIGLLSMEVERTSLSGVLLNKDQAKIALGALLQQDAQNAGKAP